MKRVNVNISDELHKRLKIACACEEKELSEVIRECIERFVERVEKKQKK